MSERVIATGPVDVCARTLTRLHDCYSSSVCCSGYDFGYMIRILSGENLAVEESQFFVLLKLYFQNIYDVKYLMKSCKNLKGGLQEVADQLEVSG